MNMLLVAGALAVQCAVASTWFAQSEDPLNVEDAGVAVQDWQLGVAAIQAVPSPIGSALPGAVYVEVGRRGAEATLYLDNHLRQYTYDCPEGRCVGFATDLWNALDKDSQRAYASACLDALMQTYPDLGIYRVILDRIGWAVWDTAHGRVLSYSLGG